MDTLQKPIDGRWTDAPERSPAINPATGQQIAWLPKSDRAIARDAIAAAKAARAGWAEDVGVETRRDVRRHRGFDRREPGADCAHAEPGAGQAAFPGHRRGRQGRRRLSARGELGRQMKGETLPAEDPTKLVMTYASLGASTQSLRRGTIQ